MPAAQHDGCPKSERGVSFDEVLRAVSLGALLDVLDHPSTEQYPNPRVFVVGIRGYVSPAPFVETDSNYQNCFEGPHQWP